MCVNLTKKEASFCRYNLHQFNTFEKQFKCNCFHNTVAGRGIISGPNLVNSSQFSALVSQSLLDSTGSREYLASRMMTCYRLYSNTSLAWCFTAICCILPVVIGFIHFHVTALKDRRELKIVQEISQLSKAAKKFTSQKKSFGYMGKSAIQR